MTLEQYRKDAKYLSDTLGQPSDYCGAWCNCGVLEDILFKDHSAKAIKNHLGSMIDRYFDAGYERGRFTIKITLEDLDKDSTLEDIAERHCVNLIRDIRTSQEEED